MIARPRPMILLVLFALVASAILYIAAFRADRFGFYRDDSMYVVMSKSLATNRGYRVLSLPGEPTQAKSPPFHPFLLSLIWRIYPDFPGNVAWMIMLSVAASVCFLGLTWRYLVGQGYAKEWQALIVVVLVGLNWRSVVLAGGVYSEMIYAALSVGALCLAEEYEKRRKSWTFGLALGTATGVVFLTRSAGIALLLAVACYYLLKRFKRGFLPTAIAAAIVLGWFAWGSSHGPSAGDVNAGFYESYFSTFTQVVGGQQAQGLAGKLGILAHVAYTNAIGLILTSAPLVCLGLNYSAVIDFRFGFPPVAAGVLILIVGGFLRQIRGGVRLLHVYLIAYLAIHLLWPYTAYDRFLMPLLPFLILFAVIEMGALWLLVSDTLRLRGEIFKKMSAALIAAMVVSAAGLAFYNYGVGLYRALESSTLRKAVEPAADDREAIEWIRTNTQPSDILICYRDPLYYLYTGRQAVRSVFSREGGLLDSEGDVNERSKALFQIAKQSRAKYLIITTSDFDLESQPEAQRDELNAIVQQNADVFSTVFRASDGRSTVCRIDESVLSTKAAP